MRRGTLFALLAVGAALALPVAAGADPYEHTTQPTAVGTGGAAATVDSVATGAARDVLRRGGNAVDAAVAAAAVLGVTEPFSCGIGGGGFMVIRTPKGKVTTIDSRETAPARMRPDSFFENGAVLPFNDARYSGLSAGTPGTPAAWEAALKRYGSWDLRRALAPAIDVARRGFVVDDTFNAQITPNIEWFDDIPSTAALYLDPDGTAKDAESVLRNPDMARAYERIARYGARKGFYRGPIAEAMAAAAQRPPVGANADKRWRPGLLTVEDLARYRVERREPTRVDYRGYDVYSMGPPSSGGSTVGEALNLLEHIPGYPAKSDADKLHYFLEASRFAFADRNVFLADPRYEPVPLRGLLSDAYAADRARLIGETAAPSPVRPRRSLGVPAGPRPRRRARHVVLPPAQSTTHLTVADKHGMVVSYTFTIESTGGNGIVVPGCGFLLNNELTDFNIGEHGSPERTGGRQAAALLDRADVRGARPAAVPGRRLAGRGHDHHDGAADPDGADRLRPDAAAGDRRPAGEPAQRPDDGSGGGLHRRLRHGARRQGPRVRRAGGDRRRDRHRVPAGRRLPRGRRTGPPRRRRGAGGAALAGRPVGEHRQHGAGVVHDGVRAGQRLGAEGAGGDRDHADAVDARAGDVARGVADHDGARPLPAAGPLARDRGQQAAVLGVRAEAALSRLEVGAEPGAGELAPRDRLEVPGHEREPVDVRLGRERVERLGHARRDARGEVGRAQLLVGPDGGGLDLGGARVDPVVADAGGAEQVARDRGVRAPRRLHVDAVERDAVHRPRRAPERGRVLRRGTLEQRAVDVPEQEEGLQRRNEMSAVSFCAKAAISFAVLSTSSSCTISTGECM